MRLVPDADPPSEAGRGRTKYATVTTMLPASPRQDYPATPQSGGAAPNTLALLGALQCWVSGWLTALGFLLAYSSACASALQGLRSVSGGGRGSTHAGERDTRTRRA